MIFDIGWTFQKKYATPPLIKYKLQFTQKRAISNQQFLN
jgi:hypothetical protein